MSSIRGTMGDYRHYPPSYPQAGSGITIDNSDPVHPIIDASDQGGITEIQAGDHILVDSTEPKRPIVNTSGLVSNVVVPADKQTILTTSKDSNGVVTIDPNVSMPVTTAYFDTELTLPHNNVHYDGSEGIVKFNKFHNTFGNGYTIDSDGRLYIKKSGSYVINVWVVYKCNNNNAVYTFVPSLAIKYPNVTTPQRTSGGIAVKQQADDSARSVSFSYATYLIAGWSVCLSYIYYTTSNLKLLEGWWNNGLNIMRVA